MRYYEKPLDHLVYLWRGTGRRTLLARVLRQIFAPVYRKEQAYLTLTVLDDSIPGGVESYSEDEHGTSAIVIRSADDLQRFRAEFPDTIDFDDLRDHLEREVVSYVILARRPNENGSGHSVIGQRKMLRGVFEHWFGKLSFKLDDDVMMVLTNFVVPECRGQQVQKVMRGLTHEFGFNSGMPLLVGAVSTHNLPSIRSHRKRDNPGRANVLGPPITYVSILGGLIERVSPKEQVLDMLADPDAHRLVLPGA